MATQQELIKTRYETGATLFSKHALQGLRTQLHSVRICLDDEVMLYKEILVHNLNGHLVRFPIERDQIEVPDHRPDHDGIYKTKVPVLGYRSIQRLLSLPEGSLYAYLPVMVWHRTERRDRKTKELLADWPEADYHTVKRRFAAAKENFGHEAFGYIKAALASAVLPVGIRKVVALACGTMTKANDHSSYRRSMAQHALALALRDHLSASAAHPTTPGESNSSSSSRSTVGMPCYAQDPLYTPLDKRVLEEDGITVVEDPAAFLEIDEASVVISVNPSIPVRQIIADIADPGPAIIIWNRVVDSGSGRTLAEG
ncbi:uncharacterized protein B0T15DRAFT_506238 [Chaetomium strumarium]|uniref:SRR1-like domain-containing protein n=1 Tax=Chaetomium strumarium TaxID=1170767 RepID=A0AAJ0H0A3_9PEZI|nr:hypothetical protein B0T15DRAFT_506238 [Chaetomium strumarium]